MATLEHRKHLTIVLTSLLFLPAFAWPALATDGDALRNRCEHGITLALLGRTAQAESVFVALLAESPGDPRALNNLGNIRFLSGEPDVAAAFYTMAAAKDSADAGILLNHATSLMVLGRAAEAQAAAARAIQLAGGISGAGALLGLAPGAEPEGADKAAPATAITAEEIRAMLLRAVEQVPVDAATPDSAQADSLGAAAPGTTGATLAVPSGAAPAGRPNRIWRTAGPRASEAVADPDVFYWKR